MNMYRKIGKFARKFKADTGGQFAVITAMVGLPILMIGAAVLDVSQAHSTNVGLRNAIDTAALAAVIPDNMTNEERYAYAQTVFDKNYFGQEEAVLKISGNRERVDIIAETKNPTIISGVLGVNHVTVRESTAAVLTRSDTVCVLALDPKGSRALEFADQAVFNAPACSVQVNSSSPVAMVSGLVTPPKAKSFCVSGISEGNYDPLVKHACSSIEDPYENLQAPADNFCYPKELVSGYLEIVKAGALMGGFIGNNAVMLPGTYCDGLTISGVNITLLPGTYIIKDGPLVFTQGSQVVGKDVSFVLKGESRLIVEKNADIQLKAPSHGSMAGLVFYKVPNIPAVGKAPKLPEATSVIQSGGGMSIIGTAYFPTQELSISSENRVASKSPATSFIAYRLKFSGKSNTQVHVNHEAGGIPPMLPRSDDGARLVK